MTMRFPRREAEPARETADDQTVWFGPPGFGDRSCCCPARPVVRVLIPPSSVRPHFVDLFLCHHHYRASRGALAAANAVAIDEAGSVLLRRQGALEQAAPGTSAPNRRDELAVGGAAHRCPAGLPG